MERTLFEPGSVILCLLDEGVKHLTSGLRYVAARGSNDYFVAIINDKGMICSYDSARFQAEREDGAVWAARTAEYRKKLASRFPVPHTEG